MAWIRRLLVACGLAVIAMATAGVLRAASVGAVPYSRFLAVSAVFGDVLVMPVVLVAGAVTARLLPAWVRVPVQAALYISAAVVLVSIPLLLGYGRNPALPSALPRDYPRGLIIVLTAVWLSALAVALFRRIRLSRNGGPDSGGGPVRGVRPEGGPQNGSRP